MPSFTRKDPSSFPGLAPTHKLTSDAEEGEGEKEERCNARMNNLLLCVHEGAGRFRHGRIDTGSYFDGRARDTYDRGFCQDAG